MYEQFENFFTFVERTDTPHCAVKLTVEPYQDVIVLLKKFQIVHAHTPNEGIEFDYEIVELPLNYNPNPLRDKEFTDLLGDIFLFIMERKFMREDALEQANTPLEPMKVEYDATTGETTVHFTETDES